MKAIGESIFELLTTDQSKSSFYDRVNGRVSPEYGRQGEDTPYAVFDQLNTNTVRLAFGTDKMLHESNYEIQVCSRVEEGASEIAEIADLVVAIINGSEDASVTGFERLIFDVIQGTTIERADDMLVASIVVRAKGIQTTGL